MWFGLRVPCSNVFSGRIDMAGFRSALVETHEFDPESDLDAEAPEEVQTLRLLQGVSEWLVSNFVYLDILFLVVHVCVLTQLLTCS